MTRAKLFLACFAIATLMSGDVRTQSTLQPLVYIEADPNGARYVRVTERRSTPIAASRYRIPFDLSSGAYHFRAHFERNGARVGATVTIDEVGQIVGTWRAAGRPKQRLVLHG